ncbi:MAG: DUF4827 domain-containing protein [Bacteroidaceae bacterium]|nr:DUF4827 domain-containing protein [Bacteroidaceae bacterium]
MRKLFYPIIALLCIMTATACHDEETYAEMKKKERQAIDRFLKDNDVVGPIEVISEEQFAAQDSLTDTVRNQFVLFDDDGIYMQIVNRGTGKTMAEMAKEQSTDSTISKTILCRFMEYDIKDGEITNTNLYSSSTVDKMLCKYSHRSRSYTASFTYGYMLSHYNKSYVPKGWLKPLEYVRLTRNSGRIAKVKLIVPHTSGTENASNYVLPMYYEISYQLGI